MGQAASAGFSLRSVARTKAHTTGCGLRPALQKKPQSTRIAAFAVSEVKRELFVVPSFLKGEFFEQRFFIGVFDDEVVVEEIVFRRFVIVEQSFVRVLCG